MPARPPEVRAEPALKPNQPTHSRLGADHGEDQIVGREGGLRVTDALAKNERGDQTGDARVDVHDRAAGEVEDCPS